MTRSSLRWAAIVLGGAAVALGVALFLRLPGERTKPADDESAGAAFEAVGFDDLPGWDTDDPAEALAAFRRSCERIAPLADDAPAHPAALISTEAPDGGAAFGRIRDWRAACAAAGKAPSARAFFESQFRPLRILDRRRTPTGRRQRLVAEGRFTGYFEPFYPASASRTPTFSAAVYTRPDDLVTVDLGRFRSELKGQRLAGRAVDGVLDPYPDHAAINAGAIAGRARIIAYMKPTDLLFLQIQGSGRLDLDGRMLRVGYDGGNGRPYKAVGKTLIEMDALTRDAVSMQSIRAWLDAAPEPEARKVRESNESFVFFRVLGEATDAALGPPGAEGVALTAGRSLAIDPRYTPFGAPVFVDISGDPGTGRAPIRRLLIAQDTGGAIKGPVRGDIFVGSGEAAGEAAGVLNATGEMYVLLPVAVADRLVAGQRR